MEKKHYFELLDGTHIPTAAVTVYVISFQSYKKSLREFERDKSTLEDKAHPATLYYEVFKKLCRDDTVQVLLQQGAWQENLELRKIFQTKITAAKKELSRSQTFRILRENIHELSTEKNAADMHIYYQAGDSLSKRSKTPKHGAFSFYYSDNSPYIDDVTLNYTHGASVDFNDIFQKKITAKKAIKKLCEVLWRFIYEHPAYKAQHKASPLISIRTLDAYIEAYCANIHKATLFGKHAKHRKTDLEDSNLSEVMNIDPTYITSSANMGTTEHMERILFKSSVNTDALARQFLKMHDKYAATLCIMSVCHIESPTRIDKICNNDKPKTETQTKTIPKKMRTFLLKAGLHPDCHAYDKEQLLAFIHAFEAPCREDILPQRCPRFAPLCADDSKTQPCADVL